LTNITSRACTGPLGRIPAGGHAKIIPIAEMPRRGFLAQLVKLPFIGGGLSLIGQPQAVAEPVTHELLAAYNSWLASEYVALNLEIMPAGLINHWDVSRKYPTGFFHWRPVAAPPASSRAAVVLSAVGCDWKEPRHV
jgi:hypothetical protein